MRLQRKLSNGSWIDGDRIEQFAQLVLGREVWYAPRVGREPMTSQEQVVALLATGKQLSYGDDWYAEIRDADAIKPRQPKPEARLVRCSCGHETTHPMSTSLGSSCPDCYDRMSDGN